DFVVTRDGREFRGVLAVPQQRQGPRPLVLVFPNYAGLKQFDVDQAVFLAKLGFCGLAVDLYGEQEAYPSSLRNPGPDATPEDLDRHIQGAFTAYNSCLSNPKAWRALQNQFLEQARQHEAVHPTLAAGIGYCFGGQCGLEMLRNGDDIQGFVSFHGVLQSKPLAVPFDFSKGFLETTTLPPEKVAPNTFSNKAFRLLVCNGEADPNVHPAALAEFEAEMKAAKVKDWQIHHYSNTDHGFALAPGVWSSKYHEDSDRRSTISMIHFLDELWGAAGFKPQCDMTDPGFCNASGTILFPGSKL
ncbi:Hypothetical protein SCF082_LOCUS50629, partial [Durusdinium trenchii]